MANVMLWKVLREHEGDRRYAEGETREGAIADLGHLDGTVLELIGPKPAEAPQAPAQKSEGASEKNKAETPPSNKTAKPSRRKTRK